VDLSNWLDAPFTVGTDSEKTGVGFEPAPKKRKLAVSDSFSNLESQTAMTEMVERLKEESGGIVGK
jgi:hypothetical protein